MKQIPWPDGSGDMLTVHPSQGGSGTTPVQLSTPANTTYQDREMDVEVAGGGVTATLHVTQASECLTVITYDGTAIERNNKIIGYACNI